MRKASLFGALVLLAGFSGSARAGAVGYDTWYKFYFGGAGSGAYGGDTGISSLGTPFVAAGDQPYTFTAGAEGAIFSITDAYNAGDSFDVYDFGALVGQTPFVTTSGAYTDDPIQGMADPLFSSLQISLGSGNHSITIFARDSPFGSGGAFFEVTTGAVPEPSTIAMAGLGVVAVLGVYRRRMNRI